MPGERLLDLARRDLLSAAVDQVLQAPGDEEVALPVEVAEVPRPEPAVAEGRPGGGRVALVAGGEAGPPDEDLAALARREPPARLVGDSDLGTGGEADRAWLARAGRQGIACNLVRALGHAIGLDHRDAHVASTSAASSGDIGAEADRASRRKPRGTPAGAKAAWVDHGLMHRGDR